MTGKGIAGGKQLNDEKGSVCLLQHNVVQPCTASSSCIHIFCSKYETAEGE